MNKLNLGILFIVLLNIVVMGCISSEQQVSPEISEACDLDGNCPEQSETNVETTSEDSVKISLSEISSQMTKYSYSFEGVEITYFAVLGSDGEPRIAFDACVICSLSKKGYRQEGEDVVCNNCGQHFKIDWLGEENQGGGCWPGYLPFEIEGDSLIIKKVDLESEKGLFE